MAILLDSEPSTPSRCNETLQVRPPGCNGWSSACNDFWCIFSPLVTEAQIPVCRKGQPCLPLSAGALWLIC
ncbi:hypothetical protein E2C01_008182 [Portunus trituberculatus]|uniref:SRCR domain-containing protein n=1 Tax=Portunus trituberculatus TaxID=210409 RepID=A0A5B7D037_PORTR|nr:hypothetical protein [Portunus trituberculatus]